MAGEVSIKQFEGTALHALAQNANINGGTTLDAQELQLFESYKQSMGLEPEEYGLGYETPELNQKDRTELNKEKEKIYKSTFGKDGVQTAKTAEASADAVVSTACHSFTSAHPNVNFVPKDLADRPQMTNSKYYNNVGQYAADLGVWAQKVADEYNNAANKTIEQMINNSTAAVLGTIVTTYADLKGGQKEIVDQLIDLGKTTQEQFDALFKQNELNFNATIKQIRSSAGAIIANNNKNTLELHEYMQSMEGQLHEHIDAGIIINNMNHIITRNEIDTAKVEINENTNKNAQETQETLGEQIKDIGNKIIDNINRR